jgi:hypothetical protein
VTPTPIKRQTVFLSRLSIGSEVAVADFGHHSLVWPLLANVVLAFNVFNHFFDTSQGARLGAAKSQPAGLSESCAATTGRARDKLMEVLVVMSDDNPFIYLDPLRDQDVGRPLDQGLLDVEDGVATLSQKLTNFTGYVLIE